MLVDCNFVEDVSNVDTMKGNDNVKAINSVMMTDDRHYFLKLSENISVLQGWVIYHTVHQLFCC